MRRMFKLKTSFVSAAVVSCWLLPALASAEIKTQDQYVKAQLDPLNKTPKQPKNSPQPVEGTE